MKKFLLSIFAVMLAVFSVQAQETVTDKLTSGDFAATSTQYKDFSNVKKESSAVYAGNSAKATDKNNAIQLRSKNSNSGIVTTVSGGKAKSVTIVVESGSNTLDIYGSNTPFSAAGDLYNTTATKLGSLSASGTLNITGDYEYIGLRSNNGALYLTSISIVWETNGEGGGTVEPEPDPEPETPVTPEEPEFLTPGEYADVLSVESIGVKTYNSYTDWSGVNLSSAAVYAGNSFKNNNSIQLRSSNSNSGIVTTVSGGKAKKVSIEWQDQTSTRTLNIYGKNTPYESPADLYDSNKQGTKLGSITGGLNRTTVVEIDGDYEYIGLRSNSGAMYLNWIEITWEVEPVSYTLAVGETRYSTLSLGYDAAIPQGAKAYVVSEVNSGYVTLEEVTGVIPAKEAVIIEATPGDYNFVQTTEGAAVVETNLLEGTRVDTYITEEAYVLWNVDGEACFCKADMTNGSFLNNANKAYLPASVASGAASYSFRFGEGTTGVENVEVENSVKTIYDLTGRRVEEITAPGIYIVGGKKVLVK